MRRPTRTSASNLEMTGDRPARPGSTHRPGPTEAPPRPAQTPAPAVPDLLAGGFSVITAGTRPAGRRAPRPGGPGRAGRLPATGRRARRGRPARCRGRAGRPSPARGERRGRPPDARTSGPPWSTSCPPPQALGLRPGEFCHAGPPINWDRASGPLRGALIGAMLFEGLADSPADAEAKLSAGQGISLVAVPRALRRRADGRRHLAVHVDVQTDRRGLRRHCVLLAERGTGQGAALRRVLPGGASSGCAGCRPSSGPALATAVRAAGPIDITAIVGQMVQMGDEGHNRNRAGTLMFLREILPSLIASGLPAERPGGGRPVRRRQRPLLPESGDALRQADGRRRGRHPRLHGGDGDVPQRHRLRDPGVRHRGRVVHRTGRCAEGSVPGRIRARRRQPGHRRLGDHRDVGIGGMSMAAAPAIVRFVGGAVPDALATTRRMYEITTGENPAFAIPILEFRGAPTGIDVTRVLRTVDPAADQHRDGRPGRRHRPGRGGTGHPADGMLHRRDRRAGPQGLSNRACPIHERVPDGAPQGVVR